MLNRDYKLSKIEIAVIVICIILLIVAISIYFIAFKDGSISSDNNDYDGFGGYIGGVVGTLVAIIGAIFLYRTYKIQLNVSNNQDYQYLHQQFESNFFALLSQQRDINKNISGFVSDNYCGYKYLWAIKQELSYKLLDFNYEPELLDGSKNNLRYLINENYLELFNAHNSQLGHYTNHIYTIMKYVDSSNLSFDEKSQYMTFLQSQMNMDELYILTIHSLSDYGYRSLHPLINKYSFLQNMFINEDDIIKKIIVKFYPNINMNDMIQNTKNIVFVGGIHGVGKTYFTNNVQKNSNFQILTCSEVIKWKNPAEKLVENVVDNQKRLIFNLRDLVDEQKQYLLVGHFCLINSKMEIEKIPLETFVAINPKSLIVLKEEVNVIISRLKQRDNKDYDIHFLEDFQNKEIQYAKEVSQELGIPIEIVKSGDYDAWLDRNVG